MDRYKNLSYTNNKTQTYTQRENIIHFWRCWQYYETLIGREFLDLHLVTVYLKKHTVCLYARGNSEWQVIIHCPESVCSPGRPIDEFIWGALFFESVNTSVSKSVIMCEWLSVHFFRSVTCNCCTETKSCIVQFSVTDAAKMIEVTWKTWASMRKYWCALLGKLALWDLLFVFFSYIVVVRVYFKYLMYLKRTSVCFTWFYTNVPLREKKEKLKVHFICHQKNKMMFSFLLECLKQNSL